MHRCLQLAALGLGNTAPNPMVGAVLVYEDYIIGEGYHKEYGGSHAEVNCINSVVDKNLISKSTLYVSLEPCAHFGKTPPCSDLIITHNIPNVIIGCRDTFKEVAGKGIERLQNAGIYCTVGILEKDCREMNKRFFTFHEKKRPYIILKWAQSKDAKIAAHEGSRLLISNDITNRLVHKWRSEEASILVGTNTAMQDDPSLTTRLWPGKDPLRLVIDNNLRLPAGLKLFDGSSKTIVFNYEQHAENDNIIYHQLNRSGNNITEIMSALYDMQVQSVIVEGGAQLLQSFISEGLWDEARVITNTALVVGEGLDAPVLKDNVVQHQKIDDDLIRFISNERVNK